MLTALDSGVVHRLTLFASRGHGKTEFLRFDLAPAAEKAGYKVVYVSLSSNPNAPQQVLLRALREATAGGVVKSWWRLTGNRLHEAQIQGAIETDAETTGAKAPRRCTSDELKRIADLLHCLCRGKRAGKVLLLIDDFDRLADVAFEPIVYSLRTILEGLRDNIKVVYTGSSRQALSGMFDDSSAPFYLSSTWMELPILDRDFVNYECAVFEKWMKLVLDRDGAWDAFNELDRCPAEFMRVMTEAGMHRETDSADLSNRARRH